MNYTKICGHVSLFALIAAAACGPDEDDSDGANDDSSDTGNTGGSSGLGLRNVITALGTVTVATDQIILRTALNNDGTLIAIATQDSSFDDHVTIYSTADGAQVAKMKELGEPGEPLTGDQLVEVDALLWGNNNELTAILSFANHYTWDSTTGDVLRSSVDGSIADKCSGPDLYNAFHPTGSLTFSATQGLPADNTICKVDLASNTREVVTLTEGPVVEWATFDTTGGLLWVSFSDPTEANFYSKDIVATVSYDPVSMTPGSETIVTTAQTVAAGPGFHVTMQPQIVLAPGGELNAYDDNVLVSATGNVMVADISGSDEINVIRLPAGNIIGTLPDDVARARSFSQDGTVLAVVDNGLTSVSVHDVSETTGFSAFLPEPIPPAGNISGTITIDGVEESLSGSCEVIVDDTIGPVQFTSFATTSGGWSLQAHAQNGLAYSSYTLEKDGLTFVNSTTIAQNFALERPTAVSDGTSIEGAASLITFSPSEFYAPVEDAAHPSGYQTIEIVINGSCAQ